MAKGTTTQENQPYAPAQGALATSISDAGKLYKSGVGANFWTGPTSAPLSLQQQNGLGMQQTAANKMNNWMQGGQQRLDSITGAGPSYSERNLGDVASGKFLGGGDPYFEDLLGISSRKAQDAVNLQASGMGRSGSGANYGNVAREIADIQTGARSNQYNQERQNQVQATGMMDDQRNMGFDRSFAAFDRMPAAFGYGQMPGQALRDIGGVYQTQAQNVLDDQIRMFDASQAAPWEQLGRYNAIAQGVGGLGGTTTQKQSGGLGQFLGNALAIAGML